MIKVGGYMPLTKPHPFHYKYQEYLYNQDYFMKSELFAPFTTRAIICEKNWNCLRNKWIYKCLYLWFYPMKCFDIIPFSSEYNNSIVSLFLGDEI